jgi:hypothetical protein
VFTGARKGFSDEAIRFRVGERCNLEGVPNFLNRIMKSPQKIIERKADLRSSFMVRAAKGRWVTRSRGREVTERREPEGGKACHFLFLFSRCGFGFFPGVVACLGRKIVTETKWSQLYF